MSANIFIRKNSTQATCQMKFSHDLLINKWGITQHRQKKKCERKYDGSGFGTK